MMTREKNRYFPMFKTDSETRRTLRRRNQTMLANLDTHTHHQILAEYHTLAQIQSKSVQLGLWMAECYHGNEDSKEFRTHPFSFWHSYCAHTSSLTISTLLLNTKPCPFTSVPCKYHLPVWHHKTRSTHIIVLIFVQIARCTTSKLYH